MATESQTTLVPLTDSTVIGVGAAARIAGVSQSTIIRWSNRYGIGRQIEPGAPWRISAPAVRMVKACDLAALEDYRARRFDSSKLAPYMKGTGQ